MEMGCSVPGDRVSYIGHISVVIFKYYLKLASSQEDSNLEMCLYNPTLSISVLKLEIMLSHLRYLKS